MKIDKRPKKEDVYFFYNMHKKHSNNKIVEIEDIVIALYLIQ